MSDVESWDTDHHPLICAVLHAGQDPSVCWVGICYYYIIITIDDYYSTILLTIDEPLLIITILPYITITPF